MRLHNKVAVITGGGTGIGRAIAQLYTREGASVAVSGRRLEPLQDTVKSIQDHGGKGIAVTADVSKTAEVQKLINTTIATFGSVDILVNNAGVYIPNDAQAMSEQEWDTVMSIDLKGVWLCIKEVLPHMVKQGSGKIINVSSIAGLIGFEQSAAYCAAKGAVINLTREIALDYAKKNIRVNGIAPGLIETDMTKPMLTDDATKKIFLDKIPANCIGAPEDIAHTAVFLASNESDYIVGQTLIVDGGFTIK